MKMIFDHQEIHVRYGEKDRGDIMLCLKSPEEKKLQPKEWWHNLQMGAVNDIIIAEKTQECVGISWELTQKAMHNYSVYTAGAGGSTLLLPLCHNFLFHCKWDGVGGPKLHILKICRKFHNDLIVMPLNNVRVGNYIAVCKQTTQYLSLWGDYYAFQD